MPLWGANASASAASGADIWASAPGGAGPASFIHYAIRACSGHSYQFIDTERLCVPLTEGKMLHISTLVHVTQRSNLQGIVRVTKPAVTHWNPRPAVPAQF